MKYVYIFLVVSAILITADVLYYASIYGNHMSYSVDVHTNSILPTKNTLTRDQSPTLLFIGDIMMGRNVELLMDTQGDNYPFVNIADFLSLPTAVIANHEGPVLTEHTRTPSLSFHFTFEKRMPSVLAAHNISIVSLANNHTYDYGVAGYNQTVHYLDEANIKHFGNPFSFGSQDVLRTMIGDKKFIFVGFNLTDPNFDMAAASAFVKSIPHAPDEFLVAFNHGGTEYELHSGSLQERFYRSLIDNGVDVVIAAHPHVTQEIEVYKGRAIFYSLGNFIFDQYFSKDVEQGLAVQLSFADNGINFDLIPIQSHHSQPEVMSEPDKTLFLKALAQRSTAEYRDQLQQGHLFLTK